MEMLPIAISAEALSGMPEGSYRLIDTRDAASIAYGSITGAEAMTETELLHHLPADKQLVLVCSSEAAGQAAAGKLREAGVPASVLSGGYAAWLLWHMSRRDADAVSANADLSLSKKYRQKIWCKFTRAINTYDLLQPGDKVAVCISGGKDSMLMAKLFQKLMVHSKFPFEVEFLVMDPGYSPANRKIIEINCEKLRIPAHFFHSDIFDSVFNIEKSPCYLCARMRRGYLYSYARQLGCNKIALGHHFDDVIETTLMGMLYGAQIQTMMPKLHSSHFEGMELIRPMYLIREDDIKGWRDYNDLHFLQCACKFTENCAACDDVTVSKRQEAKTLIRQLKKTTPDIENHIFRSMENVCLDTVIAWKSGGKTHHFLDSYDEAGRNGEE